MNKILIVLKFIINKGISKQTRSGYRLDWYQSLKQSICTENKNLEDKTVNKLLM